MTKLINRKSTYNKKNMYNEVPRIKQAELNETSEIDRCLDEKNAIG